MYIVIYIFRNVYNIVFFKYCRFYVLNVFILKIEFFENIKNYVNFNILCYVFLLSKKNI